MGTTSQIRLTGIERRCNTAPPRQGARRSPERAGVTRLVTPRPGGSQPGVKRPSNAASRGYSPLVADKVLWVFALRQIGAGMHDGLVIAVALAGWWQLPGPARLAPTGQGLGAVRGTPGRGRPRHWLIAASDVAEILTTIVATIPAREAHARPLTALRNGAPQEKPRRSGAK